MSLSSATSKGDNSKRDNEEGSEGTLKTYVFPLLSLAWPNILASVSWALQSAILLYYFGRLGNVKFLDAASLAISLIIVFIFTVHAGLVNALGTFVTQSIGRGEYEVCGVIFNRTIVIAIVITTPLCITFLFTGKFLEAFGIDKEVAEFAGTYSIALIPSAYLSIPSIIVDKFLQMQKIVVPPMVIKLTVTCLSPLFYYVLTFSFDLGYIGIAMGRSLGMLLNGVALIAYIYITGCCNRTLARLDWNVFKGWGEYFQIAVPSILMSCLEYSALEILNLICGRLGVAELASNAIIMDLSIFLLCIRGGMGSASCTLIGISIGEGNIHKAKRFTILGVIVGVIISSVVCAFFVIFNDNIVSLFTSEPEVLSIMKILAYIFVIEQTIDLIQSIMGMTIIGIGLQANISIGNIICYYAIYLPAAILLAFPANLSIYGIWIGSCIGMISVFVWYTWTLCRADWEKAVADAHKRIDAAKKSAEGVKPEDKGYETIAS